MTKYVKVDLLALFETHRVAKRRIKYSYTIYVTLTVLWVIFAIIPGATMKYVALTTATVALITIGYNTFEKKRLADTNNAIIDRLIGVVQTRIWRKDNTDVASTIPNITQGDYRICGGCIP